MFQIFDLSQPFVQLTERGVRTTKLIILVQSPSLKDLGCRKDTKTFTWTLKNKYIPGSKI